ncbi:MAG: hypothetical protein AAFO94_17685, partial [Bacteroidota bacterium]
MIKNVITLFAISLLLLIGNVTTAQTLDHFPKLLEQLDENNRNALLDQQDKIDFSKLMEQLRIAGQLDPFGNPVTGRGAFNRYFSGLLDGLSKLDADNTLDASVAEGQATAIAAWEEAFNSLPGKDPQLTPELAAELLDRKSSPLVEIATGLRQASVGYYRQRGLYSSAPLLHIRLASLPDFRKTWTTRWSAAGSWDVRKNPASIRLNRTTEYVQSQLDDNHNPILLDGEFAVMYNPGIKLKSIANARLLTSAGIELGTYVPAQIDPNNPNTFDNVGFTTGLGFQLGAGLAMDLFGNTTYLLATTALGPVINSPDYLYQSTRITTGIRLRNVVHLRYSTGLQGWAPNDNKVGSTLHEFTIGLLLGSR